MDTPFSTPFGDALDELKKNGHKGQLIVSVDQDGVAKGRIVTRYGDHVEIGAEFLYDVPHDHAAGDVWVAYTW